VHASTLEIAEQLGELQLTPLRRAGFTIGDGCPSRPVRDIQSERHVGGYHDEATL
jgi:hypothetical protein